jgi:hypothetical protein
VRSQECHSRIDQDRSDRIRSAGLVINANIGLINLSCTGSVNAQSFSVDYFTDRSVHFSQNWTQMILLLFILSNAREVICLLIL